MYCFNITQTIKKELFIDMQLMVVEIVISQTLSGVDNPII